MGLRFSSVRWSLCVALALFGAWSLYAQAAAFAHLSFATLKLFSLAPVLAGVALLATGRPPDGPAVHDEQPAAEPISGSRGQLRLWLWCAGGCLVTAIWLFGAVWPFWIAGVVYLAAVSHAARRAPALGARPAAGVTGVELLWLALVCAAVALLVLGVRRWDHDDAYFVGLAASAIDHPELPLYSFDSLYRSGLPPIEQRLHLAQTYEYLVAVLADITSTPVRTVYYVVLPALTAPLGVLSHWALFRRFLPRLASLVGVTAVVVLLVAWGDGHRTPGNFTLVRMYQGKAVFLLVALPLIVDSALAYTAAPGWRNWLVLMLHQCAATGLTTNGVVLAPLTVGLVLLAGSVSRRAWISAAKGLASSIPVLLVGGGMLLVLRQYGSPERADAMRSGYRIVFGNDRTGFVLLGLVLLPVGAMAARLRSAAWLSRYVTLCFALLMCPAVAEALGTFAPVFRWRILWALPVTGLLGLGIGAFCCGPLRRPWLRGAAVAACVLVFALGGPRAIHRDNWARANIGEYKVDAAAYGIAEHVVSRTPEGALALAPESVAVYVAGFQRAPALVAVTRNYLGKLRGSVPDDDLRQRRALLRFVEGQAGVLTVDEAIGLVEARGIDTVAFPETHADLDALVASLAGRGFRIERHAGYVFATRSA